MLLQFYPLAKQTRRPFLLKTTRSNSFFDLIHGDVLNPFPLIMAKDTS